MSSKERRELLEDCVKYFRERRAYRAVFSAMREKWKIYGRCSGVVVLRDPSGEERETLGRFLDRDFFRGDVRFSLKEFETALQATRFGGISLKELLEGYFGETLTTNKEEREIKAGQKELFFRDLVRMAAEKFGDDSPACRWLSHVSSRKKAGYLLILAEYEKSPEAARRQTELVCRALERLKKREKIRLAVLGAEISRNPHEFDRNTSAGKLLLQALGYLRGGAECRSAEEILLLYYEFGIRPDDLSSFTAAYGVHLYLGEEKHPAYEKFIELGEPYVLTLSNLSRIERAEAKGSRVYVVENQMVFSHLCEALAGREAALVCTSGQIKTASLILLDLLVRSGCQIRYSGDFDPEGLGIAARILSRYPDSSSLWCMTRADYERALSDQEFSERRLRELEAVDVPCLEEVKRAMIREKRAGYQEQLLEKMLEEITGPVID